MDWSSDNNPKILKFVSSLVDNIPNYVDLDTLQKQATTTIFADTINNLFPMQTPDDTWKSYAYIKAASNKPFNHKEIEDRLELAAAAQGIYEDIESISSALAGLQKEASACNQRDYAIYLEDTSDIKGYYPINTPQEIEKSAVALNNDKEKLPIEDFHCACEKIVKSAKNNNVDIDYFPATIVQHGMKKEANFDALQVVADQRVTMLGEDEEAKELYDGIVKFAKEEPHNSEYFANLFSELDRVYSIDYSKPGVIDPYAGMYSGTADEEFEKMANENSVIADIVVPYDEIKSFDTQKLYNSLHPDNAKQLESIVKQSSTAKELTNALQTVDFKLQSKLLNVMANTF